jgi:hypothetical protein
VTLFELDQTLLANAAKEMEQRKATLTYVLKPIAALRLAAVLQLALRHPGLDADNRAVAVAVVENIRRFFADAPAVLELLRRGDVPGRGN